MQDAWKWIHLCYGAYAWNIARIMEAAPTILNGSVRLGAVCRNKYGSGSGQQITGAYGVALRSTFNRCDDQLRANAECTTPML